ncbi:hypothetical protein M406DRAFT_327575 [Cryphonectria parasitica EP155]|uniref:Uncharacterized protein n=1 Tax=Cryphonectria parasitica (strain ATCC 38755 / EP155) TaxID=660469 RepID=A0A9P5CT05_CRYP1|nr:uncharacterized protein M406DRAFT_327575 [Cryphonectria parasitica EP155]KAF3769172.1 hypothetical protein M406DRAFT_327575 [Cryphonectria parasitica EP155]
MVNSSLVPFEGATKDENSWGISGSRSTARNRCHTGADLIAPTRRCLSQAPQHNGLVMVCEVSLGAQVAALCGRQGLKGCWLWRTKKMLHPEDQLVVRPRYRQTGNCGVLECIHSDENIGAVGDSGPAVESGTLEAIRGYSQEPALYGAQGVLCKADSRHSDLWQAQ